jgi:hypothetical protein
MTGGFRPLTDVARVLGTSDSALRTRLHRNQLPFPVFKDGRRLLVRNEDFVRYVDSMRPLRVGRAS